MIQRRRTDRVNTLIFRTVAPFLTALMLLFSVFVLLRGHNEPGGGFIGGLIAASGLAIYGIARGVGAVRRALFFHPLSIAGFGLLLSTAAGLLSILFAVPFMTGLWIYPTLLGAEVPLSSVLLFDIGVYLVVLGAITSIALALEEKEVE
nr:Na(+)/H(+) antiporter subunit B [Rhizobium laguerreae]